MTLGMPWLAEPDRLDWRDPFTGYECEILRESELLHLAGYVRVPEGHPLHGRSYADAVPEVLRGAVERALRGTLGKRDVLDLVVWAGAAAPQVGVLLNVHGGVNAARAHPGDAGWWFGFHCAHAGDLMPGLLAIVSRVEIFQGDTYRTVEFVRAECAALAAQLHHLATLTETPLT